jgi:2,4-dienoyl-CoA reductase-like NADH-dependent reductase (Old Yellow Enzyme family)
MVISPDTEFSDPRFEAFKNIALAAKAHGSLTLEQLNHIGRKVDKRIQPNPISAPDVQLSGRQANF